MTYLYCRDPGWDSEWARADLDGIRRVTGHGHRHALFTIVVQVESRTPCS